MTDATISQRRVKDRRPLVAVLVIVAVMLTVALATRDGGNDSTDAAPVAMTEAPGDWKSGIDRITRIENELFSSPDPARVGEIMTADCACFASTTNRLTTLRDTGRRVDGPNIIVNSATLNQEVTPDRVRVFMVLSDNGKAVVDADGNVVSTSPRADRVGLLYTIVRGTDKHWRLAERGPLPQVEVR